MKFPNYILLSLLAVPSMLMAQQLHYDKPATYFEEALPIGNGNLGAMIYGGVGEDRISINDITLWSGEPHRDVFRKDAWKALADVRRLLDEENYSAADDAYRAVQGYYSENYQPLGTLTITDLHHSLMGNKPADYARSLDLATATASVSYSGKQGRETRTYFASAPDSVIVVKLTAADGETLNKRLTFHTMLRHQTQARRLDGSKAPFRALQFVPEASSNGQAQLTVEGHCAYSLLPNYVQDGETERADAQRGIHFRTLIRVFAKDGSVTAPYDDVLQLEGCTEALIVMSNVTSFNGPEKDPAREGRDYISAVEKRLAEASAKSYDELYQRHLADYQPIFDRVKIDLGATAPEIAAKPTDVQLREYGDLNQVNPDLEELYYQYGRYLLIASSRTEGVPANLQGLWNEYITPPWSSNYTVNINVEENYWHAETTALPEMHRSLLRFIQRLAAKGHETARNYYNVEKGWTVCQNSDLWALTNPVGMGTGDPCWANWPLGGAWISTHLWEHYSFSMDKAYLQEVYPALRGAADFCMGWLIEKNGYLMTSPSTSPEAKFIAPDGKAVATLYGGTADLAMIRECLLDTRAAAKALGIEKNYQDSITAVLDRLYPYHIGKRGNLMEWYHDFDDEDWKHRHQSHLFGLYPGHHLSVDATPELAAACAKTLEIKGDKTTGWSTGWRVNLFARLRDAAKAYHIFRVLLTYISPDEYVGPDKRRGGGTYPNLFDSHSPFQIDGNFGGTAGVTEMLVQSELKDDGSSSVILLPALPEQWAGHGSLSGVRVRGGFTLSFAWSEGRVTSLSVSSTRSDRGKIVLCLPGRKPQTVTLTAGRSRTVL